MLLEYEKKLFTAIHSKKDEEVVNALNEIKKINELVNNCDFLKENVKFVSIEAKNDEDCTPLMEAAKTGYPNILKALIDARADVNATNKDGQTALMLVAQKGLFSSVIILLEAGANRNLKDNKEQKAADLALQSLDCHDVLTNSRFLLPAEMKLFKAVCLNNLTLLQDTINEIALIHSEFKKHSEFADQSLAPSINIKNRKGQTPLLLASVLGHSDCLQLLLAADGIEINVPDKNDSTALIYAAAKGHNACVEKLLSEEKIEVNHTDYVGATALIWAAVEGHEKIVQLLINKEKTDLDARKILSQSITNHFTALHFAAKKGFGRICEMLIAIGANYHLKGGYENETAAFYANQSGCGEVFRTAVQKREQLIQRVKPKNIGFIRSLFSARSLFGGKSGYALVPMSSESNFSNNNF